jgi:hypothetical protein
MAIGAAAVHGWSSTVWLSSFVTTNVGISPTMIAGIDLARCSSTFLRSSEAGDADGSWVIYEIVNMQMYTYVFVK